MLGSFNDIYQKRNNHLEIRLKKLRIKLARWWIYFRYSGNPNYNPYILTSRPKNIPFISLRTEEYGKVLINQEYVKNQWVDFWRQDNDSSYKHNKNQLISSAEFKKNPAHDIKSKDHLKKKRLYGKNEFEIYSDPKLKEASSQKPKQAKLVKPKRKKKNNEKRISLVTKDALDESGTLSSFENDLLECSAFTTNRKKLLPFGAYNTPVRKIVTPTYFEYESSVKEEHEAQLKNRNCPISCVNKEEKSPILTIVDPDAIHDINLENEFNHESFYNNKKTSSYLTRVISNKPNYKVSGFDGDKIAIHNKNENHAVRNWTVKSIKSGPKNTFDNRLTLDSDPLGNYSRKYLAIQNPEFFDHNLSNFKTLERQKIDNYKEVQVKNYIRPKKVRREKHKKKYKRPISKIITDSTQDDVIAVFRKIKSNTKEKILDTFAFIPQTQNHHPESKSIDITENAKNIDLSKTGFYRWKNFNNHNKKYNLNKPELGKSREKVSDNYVSSEDEVPYNKAQAEKTYNKLSKIVTFISPKENETYNDKENCDPEIDLFYDEFGIIADYETNETL